MNPDVDDRDPRDEPAENDWADQFRSDAEENDWVSVFEVGGAS